MANEFAPRSYEELLNEMTDGFQAISGYSPKEAGDLYVRLCLLAQELSSLHEKLDFAGRMLFPDTAQGEYLDRHAQTRGLVRKEAVPAAGVLRFSRDTAAAYDISIPQGTLCCTRGEEPVRFATTAGGALEAGQTQVDIPAQAVDGGRMGNVAAGAVTVLVTPPQGIAQVENPAPFAGGADEEDDETLRERLLAAYASVANGTNAAYYYNLAMSFPFVRSAHVIPRKRGRGTVDIMVDVGSSDTGRLSEISDAVASQREIGVDAAVSQAEAKSVSVSVSLTAASGFIPELVVEAAQAALEDFGGRLGVSQPLKLIDLYTCLIHIQGVDNFQVTAPDSDVIPTETQVIRPTFRVTAKGGEDL